MKMRWIFALALLASTTSTAFATKAPVGPPFRLAPEPDYLKEQGVRIEVGNEDRVCIQNAAETLCGRWWNHDQDVIRFDARGQFLNMGFESSDDNRGLCVLDTKGLRCVDQPNPCAAENQHPTDMVTGNEFTCALVDGRIKCAGTNFDLRGYLGKPDYTFAEFSGAKRLFRLTEDIFCAETSADTYRWDAFPREISSEDSKRERRRRQKRNSRLGVFRLSRLLTLKKAPSHPIRFLEVIAHGFTPNAEHQNRSRGLRLHATFVDGNILRDVLVELTAFDIFGKYGSGLLRQKQRLVAEYEVPLPSEPKGHINGTSCYLFDQKIRCLNRISYNSAEEKFQSSDYSGDSHDVVSWLENLEGVSQISGTAKYACALTSSGLQCTYFEDQTPGHPDYFPPEPLLKAAGSSFRITIRNLENSVKRAAPVFYLEKAQLLRKQADILDEELKTESRVSPSLLRLFTALSVRTVLETTHSAIVEQNVLPSFQSDLNQVMSETGIQSFSDFGYPRPLIRLALRLLASDLQVLRQHITEPQVRSRFEDVVAAIGEALAQNSAALLDLRFLKDALATLSTAPRSQSFALQALGLVEYLEMGGILR